MHGHADSGDCGLLVLSDAMARVEIAPAIGGGIASFHWQRDGRQQDWLRPATREALATGDASGMGCFPLVPYSNRVRGGRFSFCGRKVALPITPETDPHFEHGHGWRRPWQIAGLSRGSLSLLLDHPADAWPWHYQAEQKIELMESGGLRLVLTVTNLDDDPMPLGVGYHPYFPKSPNTRLTANVHAMWATDEEILPTELVPPRPEADPNRGMAAAKTALDNVFTAWDGHAQIDWPEASARLRVEADAPLRFLVLYTPAKEPYFCAEPVSNATDAFNLADTGRTDTGMIVLGPGQSLCAQVRLVPAWHHASN
ncbi:MAG: aldose 1-epimerase [Proteobacteria bacterium]|nr:aldose 1-epimerase [Pseudomonadota bacterium]